MGYTNSPLVNYTKLSPNHSGVRNHTIDRITPHCVVGQCTVEALGEVFAPASREASSNYGVGYDGRVGMYVEEKNRSWCSSSKDNDHRAVTIEVASDTTYPYAMKDAAYNTLIDLCVDICKRNGKNKLLWLGNKDKTLNYEPAQNEMVITAHRWFAATECPGDWLYSRLGDLAAKVTARLTETSNSVKAGDIVSVSSNAVYYNGVDIPDLVTARKWIVKSVSGDRAVIDKSTDGKFSINSPINVKYLTADKKQFEPYTVKLVTPIHKSASADSPVVGTIDNGGVYTIVEENGKWGKLKSGAGWISLDCVKKI